MKRVAAVVCSLYLVLSACADEDAGSARDAKRADGEGAAWAAEAGATTGETATGSDGDPSDTVATGSGTQENRDDAADATDEFAGSDANDTESADDSSDAFGEDASNEGSTSADADEHVSDAVAGEASDASPNSDETLSDVASDADASTIELPDGSGIDSDAAAMAGQCRPERTTTVPGGSPIEAGVFCDVVFLCATLEQASSAKLLAPDFRCTGATGEYGCGQQVCELFPSAQDRRLIQGEVDQICELSNLDVGAGAIQCRVYL